MVKNPSANAGDIRDAGTIPGSGRSPWRRDRLPTPVFLGFPCGSVGKESTCNAGDPGLIPGSGRSLGERKGYPLQYSALENSMDCIVHGVTMSWTRLSEFHFQQNKRILRIFPTQGLNSGLLHCRQILYHLSHLGLD